MRGLKSGEQAPNKVVTQENWASVLLLDISSRLLSQARSTDSVGSAVAANSVSMFIKVN